MLLHGASWRRLSWGAEAHAWQRLLLLLTQQALALARLPAAAAAVKSSELLDDNLARRHGRRRYKLERRLLEQLAQAQFRRAVASERVGLEPEPRFVVQQVLLLLVLDVLAHEVLRIALEVQPCGQLRGDVGASNIVGLHLVGTEARGMLITGKVPGLQTC